MRIHRMDNTDMSVSESPHANELGVRLLEFAIFNNKNRLRNVVLLLSFETQAFLEY